MQCIVSNTIVVEKESCLITWLCVAMLNHLLYFPTLGTRGNRYVFALNSIGISKGGRCRVDYLVQQTGEDSTEWSKNSPLQIAHWRCGHSVFCRQV